MICDCPRNEMILKLGLEFKKSQRSNVSDKGDMHMGWSDTKKSRRQTRLLEKKRGSTPKRDKGNIYENLLDID